MLDAGFFSKQIQLKPQAMNAPGVREICSVSECISSGPENWIQKWLRNDWGWFNLISDALGVIPPGEGSAYRLFAYRIHPEVFRAGHRVPLAVVVQRHGGGDRDERVLSFSRIGRRDCRRRAVCD
jgi:hypothetical protein